MPARLTRQGKPDRRFKKRPEGKLLYTTSNFTTANFNPITMRVGPCQHPLQKLSIARDTAGLLLWCRDCRQVLKNEEPKP